jgi:ABC-type multidrug transport system ATPase subunit
VSAAAAPSLSSVTTIALEAESLAHRYGRRVGLEPVSFALESPGAVAVTGPNGAGKSTLLRILAGLLRPSAGRSSLRVAGREVPAPARRAHVGFAAPTLAFYEELTALENLGFAAEARGIPTPRERAVEALARVGLSARADDRVGALSSGLVQRLKLAFALLDRPALLLLDEPGSHLDDEGRATVAAITAEHARDGLVVLATNDDRELRLAARRIELRGRGLGHPA